MLCAVAMVFGAIIAWSCYLDYLAAILFLGAIIPSQLCEDGYKEMKEERRNA